MRCRPSAAAGPEFTLARQADRRPRRRRVTADGTLAGAALDMASAVRNCVKLLDLPLAEALRLAAQRRRRFWHR
jgi:N-acetylglucosamine-6-phosphate deacetylase